MVLKFCNAMSAIIQRGHMMKAAARDAGLRGAGILRRGVGGASNGARLLAQQGEVACVIRRGS